MQKFLIIKPSSLGDVIHGLQVAQSLKDQQPNAHITWVVGDAFAPIVEACECIDRVLIFQRKGGFKAFWKLIQTIRQEHYQYVLDFQGLARSGLMTFFAKASQKIGRYDAREFARFAYHTRTLPSSHYQAKGNLVYSKIHAIDILLYFLSSAGLKPELTPPLRFKPLTPPLKLSEPPLLLFPNSRRPEKEWPYFKSLTESLIHHYPTLPILWLGQSPLPLPRNAASGSFINLISQTSLLEALALIQSARLCVANDSGPMHMAAALQKPVLALFGPTLAERYGPYPLNSPRHTVLHAPESKLSLLTPETVLESIQTCFKENS